MDIFQQIWDWICGVCTDALEWVVGVLPDSPFQMLANSPIKPYLGYINYFVPVDFIVNALSLWLVAVGGYYLWSIILRWIKAVD